MSSPFQIAIPDSSLDLLKKKLELSRLPDEINEAGWDYGAPLSDIRRLVARWKDGYNWRKHEKALNEEMPQFTMDIAVEGHGVLNIHYVHKESKVKGVIPLLFVHGWPGTFIEVRKILPLLTADEPGQPSFHVVALGLPGYGFSEGTKKKGFDLKKYAEVGHKLMEALGYEEYVTQGGDWGAMITQVMAAQYGGNHVKAWHINMPCNGYSTPDPSKYDAEDLRVLEQTKWFHEKSNGFLQEQSTQPQTIGYSLADSPVGLLAWIYEKLVTWTDEYPWEDDEASVRTNYEVAQTGGWTVLPIPSIPLGYSFFPKEGGQGPKSWYTDPNIVFQSRHEHGGHFAAHEKPAELVGDLRKMFGKGGPAYGVVPGKDGYA
uniref:Epoxide hydrolase N-terminal domain-containing protein n=2 Tax=Moniliophthora roreri TaxID=221103 RepID=A0A0W0G3Y3_MONRR